MRTDDPPDDPPVRVPDSAPDHTVGGDRTRTVATRTPVMPGPPAWVFPDPATADSVGLLGVGADLAPETMVAAYRAGIFPWPHPEALPWYSPDPRAVFVLDDSSERLVCGVHASRSLRRTIRRCGWHTTIDRAVGKVVAGCRSNRDDGEWITDEFAAAYGRLADLGWVHTLELWEDSDLIGGVMGVLVGGVFTAESMFHRVTDASKVALVDLATRLHAAGAVLLDAQLPTAHLRRMGVVEWPRSRFLRHLAQQVDQPVRVDTTCRDVARLV